MIGLVERLRSVGRSFELGADYSIERLCIEAADRIEQLEVDTSEILPLRAAAQRHYDELQSAKARIAELEGALGDTLNAWKQDALGDGFTEQDFEEWRTCKSARAVLKGEKHE